MKRAVGNSKFRLKFDLDFFRQKLYDYGTGELGSDPVNV